MHVAPIQCVASVASVGDSCTQECLVLSLCVVAQHSICNVQKTTVHNYSDRRVYGGTFHVN